MDSTNSSIENFCLNRCDNALNFVHVQLPKIAPIFIQQRAQLYIVIDGEILLKANTNA